MKIRIDDFALWWKNVLLNWTVRGWNLEFIRVDSSIYAIIGIQSSYKVSTAIYRCCFKKSLAKKVGKAPWLQNLMMSSYDSGPATLGKLPLPKDFDCLCFIEFVGQSSFFLLNALNKLRSDRRKFPLIAIFFNTRSANFLPWSVEDLPLQYFVFLFLFISYTEMFFWCFRFLKRKSNLFNAT